MPGQVLKWLGGNIDVRVEVDTGIKESNLAVWGKSLWDVGLWNASDPAWNDITEFVLQVSIRRGKERYGERFPAGTCSIMLDNHEGLFTPGADAHSALWHLPWRPGRLIRVVAVPNPDNPDGKVALFTGRIYASNDTYGPAGHGVTTHVEAYDAAAEWAAHNPLGLDMLSLPQTGVQLTSERVHAALDRMDWPEGRRNIQTGLHKVQSGNLAQSTFEECQRAADAEGGAFFADADNVATFYHRDWLTGSPIGYLIHSFDGPEDSSAITYGGRHLWVLGNTLDTPTIYKIDPVTGEVVLSFEVPDDTEDGIGAACIVWDGTYLIVFVWDLDGFGAAVDESKRLVVIDPVSQTIVDELPVPNTTLRGLAWDGEFLWTFDDWDFTIQKRDRSDGSVVDSWDAFAVYGLTSSFNTLAWIDGELWASDTDAGVLIRFDASDPGSPVALGEMASDAVALRLGGWTGKFLYAVDVSSDTIIKYDVTTPRRVSEVQAYIGFEAGTEPDTSKPRADIVAVDTSWDLANVRNDIQFSRRGSTVYQVDDEDSISKYGRLTHRQLDFINNSDDEVAFLADRYLAVYKEADRRINSVTIVGNVDDNNEDLNRLFYDTRIGDLVQVKARTQHGWDVGGLYHVVGLEHVITADEWRVTLKLDDSFVLLQELEESSS